MSALNATIKVMNIQGTVDEIYPNTQMSNISGLQSALNNKVDIESEGAYIVTASAGTDYTLISGLSVSATSNDIITLTAAIDASNRTPQGIIISTSNNPSSFDDSAHLVVKQERVGSERMLSCTATEIPYNSTTYYVWAKLLSAGSNKVCLTYKKHKR